MRYFGFTRYVPRLPLAIIAASLILAACIPIPSEPAAVEAEPELTESNVYVDNVEIENRDGQTYVIVSGNYADSCTEVTDVTTEVDGNSLIVTTTASKPADAMCAQVLTPFEKAIPLDIGELEAGEYTVDVDGVTTTFTVGEDAAAADAGPALMESNVYVDSVEVESRDGMYYAVIGGHLPDSCTKVTDVTTEIDGNSVMVTTMASKPADALCAQVLTPFEEEFTLDMDDVEPGEYLVDVNGVTTTFTVSP